MVTSERDILEDLDISFGPMSSPSDPAPQAASKAAVLDFFETLVYNALEDGNKGLEELIQITNLPPGRLNATLTLMEIKGIIKQIPGKIFMIQWKA